MTGGVYKAWERIHRGMLIRDYYTPNGLSLLDTLSHRPIIQEVRSQASKTLLLIVGNPFQVLFHSPHRGAFHLSLTVLVHYRSYTSI